MGIKKIFLRASSVLAIASLLSSPVLAGGNAAKGEELSSTCAACHGKDGNSSADNPTNPKLAGQYESYLLQALKSYKAGTRKNPIMGGFAATLSEQDMADLAAYFASQSTSDLSTANY